MLKLYFSNISSIISSVLIVVFAVLLGMATARRNSVDNWGALVLCLFFMGLMMSIVSGTKDKVGTLTALFPINNWAFIVLSILGALAFIVEIIMIFIRKQDFWQFGFYMLSVIILIKIIIVEGIRIITYIKRA